MQIRLQVIQNRMAKKHKSYPGEPTLDMGFDEMDAVSQQETGPVTVLGMTFSNDDKRRAYFREQLRAKLPELRNIEGFPIGSDDDIVNLSDPPYYTACPNPWLNDFIAEWEQEKLQLEAEGKRQPNVVVNEPYASDVSEGKANPIYMAHAYHTKVPHPAIMRYILHYTQPGDIIFDGFAGTGMTGVAAGKCRFENDITRGRNIGVRRCICNDLSPIASFISYNFNHPCDKNTLLASAYKLIDKVEEKLGYLYDVLIGNDKVSLSYVLWSEVMICQSCGHEIVYMRDAYDPQGNKKAFYCPSCGVEISKRNLDKYIETTTSNNGETISVQKVIPYIVRYKYQKKWHDKVLDHTQLNLTGGLPLSKVTKEMPNAEIPEGFNTNQILRTGRHNVCDLYTKRNLLILSELWKESQSNPLLRFAITAILVKTGSLLHNVGFKNGKINLAGALPNVLYIPSIFAERNIFDLLRGKLKDIEKIDSNTLTASPNQVQSATDLRNIKDNSFDYIFVDPPFGANIMYSDLNFVHEAWLHVITNNTDEAIQNPNQNKSLIDYQDLMAKAFKEFYRVLKPGKWITVEFSNTSAAVWNALQVSLSQAGFTVASVSGLDKQQGSYKGQTTTTAVKQDLIISCFKPTEQLLYKFNNEAPETNVWDFIDELLSHLPVHLEHSNKTTAVVERSPKILYDRLISFYVQHGFPVPLNAQVFQAGLRERYAERDGMYFTPSQAAKYDELRKRTDGFQASLFFVDSEQGGIAWLNNELSTPQTYQDLQPKWMQAINGVRKGDILPELMQILEENFIKESDGKWRKPNLQDDVDLAALRHKALMREFKVYVEVAQKPRGKIKEARIEALRAGFKQCYQDKDFATIVAVGDRIPQNLLTEDEQLLQFYEIASSRI